MTVEEEKSVDEKGNPIVEGRPWSEVPTGLYLTVAMTPVRPMGDRRPIGGAILLLPKELCHPSRPNRHLTIMTSIGRPAFNCISVGAALELPADLGKDAIKRQYVVEWLTHTVLEALAHQKVNLKRSRAMTDKLGLWAATTAQTAIEATGL